MNYIQIIYLNLSPKKQLKLILVATDHALCIESSLCFVWLVFSALALHHPHLARCFLLFHKCMQWLYVHYHIYVLVRKCGMRGSGDHQGAFKLLFSVILSPLTHPQEHQPENLDSRFDQWVQWAGFMLHFAL